MLYNVGRSPEIVYDRSHNPVTLLPKTVYGFWDVPESKYVSGYVQYQKSVVPLLQQASVVHFIRTFALGDILMLFPVARQLRATYPNIKTLILQTNAPLHISPFLNAFNEGVFDRIEQVPARPDASRWDLQVLFDGLVEQDHFVEWCKTTPRIDLYRKYVELDVKEPVVWSFFTPPLHGDMGVVFCPAGSNKFKQLPLEHTAYIRDRLVKIYKKVLVAGEFNRVPPEMLLSSLQRAKACVTVDSSLLWMTHFTKTPVVLLTGPSRGKERLAHHPLIPEGVIEISLATEIGCEPCFQGAARCNGKATCTSGVPVQRLWSLIHEGVEKVGWKIR